MKVTGNSEKLIWTKYLVLSPRQKDWELAVTHLSFFRFSWPWDGKKDVEWVLYISLLFFWGGETLGCFLRKVAEGCEKFLDLPSPFLIASQSEKHKYETQELRRQCRRNIAANRCWEEGKCDLQKGQDTSWGKFHQGWKNGRKRREKWWGGGSTGRD